jgi:hypothetical protein
LFPVRRFCDVIVNVQADGQPVSSVDTKEKELVGDFANGRSEWQLKGEPVPVRVHDFIDKTTTSDSWMVMAVIREHLDRNGDLRSTQLVDGEHDPRRVDQAEVRDPAPFAARVRSGSVACFLRDLRLVGALFRSHPAFRARVVVLAVVLG